MATQIYLRCGSKICYKFSNPDTCTYTYIHMYIHTISTHDTYTSIRLYIHSNVLWGAKMKAHSDYKGDKNGTTILACACKSLTIV